MPESIKSILPMMPNGTVPAPLPEGGVASYIYKKYLSSKPEMERRVSAQIRNDLYNDGGDAAMAGMIDTVFKDPDVRTLRKQWIPFAKSNNPTKRIINEISTVYQEPAIRTVSGDENNRRYNEVVRLSRQDEIFEKVNAMVNLHRAVFVRPRVCVVDSNTREPAIDIATPADAYAIRHPNDPTRCIAVVISTGYHGATTLTDVPAYEVWTDYEKFQLTSDGRIVVDSWIEHGLGVNPWVFLSMEPPSKGIWPAMSGKDVEAGHLAIWFLNIQILKESKSNNKQNVFQGDTTSLARGQMSDSESALEVPEGTLISTIDAGVDTQQYRDNANHILEQLANSYGISAGVLHHQGVQSAEARELMRAPIEELRRKQMKVFHSFERRFVDAQEAVMRRDMPEMSFRAVDWAIKFGETRKPSSMKDSLETFEHERRLGLTNSIEFMMALRGLTYEQAEAAIQDNIDIELARNILMRSLNEINGSMGADLSGSQKPQEPTQQEDSTNAT